MLSLRTGLPGAGKTLNTIYEITHNKDFFDRPKYYHNIKNLFLEKSIFN
jgi:hypothetical protein